MGDSSEEIVVEATEVEDLSPNEISKKELLAETGISYGQLYRWKREGLIPEEWFEKRSAYTGQETFFPREQVLERIRRIQSMKDDLSLSEIRERFAQMAGHTDLRKTLIATTGMSEDLVDGLDIQWESTGLTESSLKAVNALSSALNKVGASESTKGALLSQTIKALNTAPSATDRGEAQPSTSSERG